MRRLFNRKGQSTLEYAILIAVVVGGLLAIQTYVGRALKGRLRGSTDDIGEQYSAGHMSATSTITVKKQTSKEVFGTDVVGKGVTKSTISGGKRTRAGSEQTLKRLDEEKLVEE